jgi:hypothetical protein
VLEVPSGLHAEVRLHGSGFVDRQLRADEELPLFAFAVSVLRGEEATVGRRHLATEPRDRLLHRLLPQRPRRHLHRLGVEVEQLRVVVEHLLEVRHQPALVDAVAMKTSAELIEHAAARHVLEGQQREFRHVVVA